MSIHFAPHLWKNCGLNVYVNPHGPNRCDIMIFGIIIYAQLSKRIVQQIYQMHFTAGIWKSRVFCYGVPHDYVFLIKSKQ